MPTYPKMTPKFSDALLGKCVHGYPGCDRDYYDHTHAELPVPPERSEKKYDAAMGEVRITDPKTGGQKGQKPERFDLMPFDALSEVARVYGDGAAKYEDWNWLKGYRWSLSLGALLRHVSLWAQGQSYDSETGRHHLAHAAWHCLCLVTFELRGLGTDDRKIVLPLPQ